MYYMGTGYGWRLPKWWIFWLLGNIGGAAMVFTLFVGRYVTALAGALLLVLLGSKTVPTKRKVSGSIAVFLSIVALLWLAFYWKKL